ncbi:unnamed protein product [Ectocarpus fasciculatus]
MPQPAVVAEPQRLTQDGRKSNRRNPNGLSSTRTGEGRMTTVDSDLGGPAAAATTGAAASSTTPVKLTPWSWKMLATRNSTASTSAASINSAAPGPSSSDPTAASRSGGGDGSGGRTDPATAAKEQQRRQSFVQPAAAATTTAGRGARPSSVKQSAVEAAAAAAGVGRASAHVGYQKMRISSGSGNSAAAGTAEADAAEARSRPPPAPSTSTPRYRGTVPNPTVGGTRETSKRGGNGPRSPMPPPSPGGSSDGVAAPPLSAEGGVTPRQPQATATTPSGNGANGHGAVVEVHLAGGGLKAGGWNYLDSAGGGSFEIETRNNNTTPPNTEAEQVVTSAGEEEREEQSSRMSEGFDSGFEATAVADKNVDRMTEREIIAAAEAAVASAKKAAAGTVDRTMAPSSLPEFPVDTAELLSDAVPTTPGTEGKAVTRGVGSNGKVQLGGTVAATGDTRRQRVEKESLPVAGEDGESVSRTVRDDTWWRQNAAKALAISAEMKKTPGRSRSRTGTPARSRSRSATPARSRSRSGTPAHSRSTTSRRGGVAPRDGRGTPSSRSGSVVGRSKDRDGGGGSRSREDVGGCSTEDGAEGGVAGVAGTEGPANISAQVVMIPMSDIASSVVSPTFSTISSREQAERDRERLAEMNGGGDGGYRRSSWGVAVPLSGTDDTPREHGGGHGVKGSMTGRRSRESSGWGLTSDDGGDWEQQRRRSGVWSDDGVHDDDHDGSDGSSASTSMYSDEEEGGDLSSSRSSISTGYESSAMGKGNEPGRTGTPAGEDRNGDVGGHDRGSGKYAPPSPAWPLQHPPAGKTPDAALSGLEVKAIKKKAYYESQATAEAIEGSTPSTGSDASSRQIHNLPSARMGRMPSETRALLSSRGGSLPEFFPFDAPPGSRGSRAGGRKGEHFSRAEASGPESGAAAAAKSTPSIPPRIRTSVSEGTILQHKAGGYGSRPQHASAAEAVAMVFAWTPSLLPRDGGGTTGQGQQGRPAGATPDTKDGSRSRGGGVDTSGGGAEGQGRGWRRADSQYFFSSRGSSALGMSPAGMVEHHYERHRNPSPAEMRRHDSNASSSRRSRRRRTAAKQERRDSSATGSAGRGASGLDRRVRQALSTTPTPQEHRQQQQREQRRRRQASKREVASGEQKNRAPPAIPPLPKVLFRPPAAVTATGQKQRRRPQKQDRQQQQGRQGSAPKNIAFVVAPGGAEDDHVGNGGRVSRGKSWSFAGTPTSAVFSPSSAVANPFIATRYTQHSAYSFYSNSNIPSSTSSVDDGEETKTAETKAAAASTSGGGGGGDRSGSDGGGRARGVGKMTHPLPRTTRAMDKTDGGGGGRLDADDSAQGRVAASTAKATREQGHPSTDRRTARVTATDRATDGFVSDMGGSRRSAGSGSRPIYRTMSLRGRSLFSGGGGNAGTGERRAVSMSSLRSRGESLREDGEHHRSYSWRGGGRGVANRVCSVLSARWLFSRNRNKKDVKEKNRKDRSRGRGSSNVSRRSTYTSGGVVGVVDGREFSSSEDDSDDDNDDEVVDVTSSINIPIDGAPGRAGKTGVQRGGGGGPRDEAISRPAATGDGGSATAGGGSVGPVTTATRGKKRISFPRSAFLGFNRSAQSSMSSYSFIQHDPASRAAGGVGGGRGDDSGGVRASTSTTAAGADPGLDAEGGKGTLPETSVDFAGGGDGKANGSPKANRAAPRDNGGDGDVQYVNFNGHGGRAGGVVALRRGDRVAAVEIEGDSSVPTAGYSSFLKPVQAEQDEDEAKRKMDALLLRSRVHTHVNPVVTVAAGTGGGGEDRGGGTGP